MDATGDSSSAPCQRQMNDATPPWLRGLRRLSCAIVAASVALSAATGNIAYAESPEAASLALQYSSLQPRLAASPFGRSLVVDSNDDGAHVGGVIRGELRHSFATLRTHLRSAAEWCAMIVLHINVKGCRLEGTPDGELLTVYTGRKEYQPPPHAGAIRYRFRVIQATPEHLRVSLTAPTGPLGTRDYALELEAAPLDGARTFVVLSYGFRPSAASRLATAGYVATAGMRKTGFTTVGTDAAGMPVRSSGMRGIVERNAMRSFLALDARLASLGAPEAERFEQSLERMAALTERHPAELVEMPAAEYVAIKRREWRENGGAP